MTLDEVWNQLDSIAEYFMSPDDLECLWQQEVIACRIAQSIIEMFQDYIMK